jgi:hypothetical protein
MGRRLTRTSTKGTSEKTASKKAASKKAASARPASNRGKYVSALLSALAARPKRKTKAPAVVANWLEVEARADIRALLEAIAERDPGYLSVGDFMIHDDALGDRVGWPGDAGDRLDVVAMVGATGRTSSSSRHQGRVPRRA